MHKWLAVVSLFGALLVGCGEPSPKSPPDAAVTSFSGMLQGTVTDKATQEPVEGAVVRFGGRAEIATTGKDGKYTLVVAAPPVVLAELALTAGKPGYWNVGRGVTDPSTAQDLELAPIGLVDNPSYVFKSPDKEDGNPYCIHCHIHQYMPWKESAHAHAAQDPFLADLYNGTAAFATREACEAKGGAWKKGKAPGMPGSVEKCYVPQGGLLADLNPGVCGGADQPTCDDPDAPLSSRPANTSVCADCHAAASAGHVAGGTNINEIDDVTYQKGIHCDFCHKIQHVTVNERPGVNGALTLLRPGPPSFGGFSKPEVFFGPYMDVILSVMGASWQPQFRTAELCSACHQWSEPGFRETDQKLVDKEKWPDGLPIQDTYHEWANAPSQDKSCQSCHMLAIDRTTSAFEHGEHQASVSGLSGWARAYGEVREHGFRVRPPVPETSYVTAPGDATVESLRNPLDVTVTPTRLGDRLEIALGLKNRGAGHSIPSGTPSRSLLLLVEASVESKPLPATGGYTVPDWVGALVTGSLGEGQASLVGAELTLPVGASWPAEAKGSVVRFAVPSGEYDDYPGTRWFGKAARTPRDKGMEIAEPAGTATIVSMVGRVATLDASPVVPTGARFFVGAKVATEALQMDSEVAVTPLAGAPGYAFGKDMVDARGQRGVPFFRAIDIVSDNRIPAGATATTRHVFDTASARGKEIAVTVTLLYRKHPFPTAYERGWTAVDVVRLRKTLRVAP
jgi:hypothetical protein